MGFKTLTTNTSNFKSYRVYQAVKLTDSLKAGKKYACGFYTVLTDSSYYASNNVSMLLSKNIMYPDTTNGKEGTLIANAQVYNYGNPVIKDTQNWILVSSIYTAKGGEQYITIGNFVENAENKIDSSFNSSTLKIASYCLDDVFVYELNSNFCLKANAGKDTTIQQGDSVFIGSYTNGIDTIRWLNQNTNTIIDSIKPGFWVKPNVTTNYTLCQVVNGCTTCDTVTVTVNPLPLKFISFFIFATPLSNGEGQGVRLKWQTMNEVNVSHYNIERSTNAKDFTVIGKVKANNKASNEYSYTDNLQGLQSPSFGGVGEAFYRIAGIDNDGKKTYSEVKSFNIQHLAFNINIYPNPVINGTVVITLPTTKATDALAWQLTITDVYGKTISQQLLLNKVNKLQLQIPKGIYIATVTNKNNTTVVNQKIVVL